MNDKPTHIIRKCILDIELPSQKTALEFKFKLSQLYQSEIVPVLNQVLDEYGVENQSISIPKLEIDFGTIASANFEKTFVQEYKVLLQQALQKHIQPNIDQQEERANTNSTHPLAAFFHFLQQGTFPWNTRIQNLEELEKTILSNLSYDVAYIKHTFSSLFKTCPQIAERLVRQFSDHFITQLFTHIWQIKQRDIKLLLTNLSKISQKNLTAREAVQVKQALLKYVIGGSNFSFNDFQKNVGTVAKEIGNKPLSNEVEQFKKYFYHLIYKKQDWQWLNEESWAKDWNTLKQKVLEETSNSLKESDSIKDNKNFSDTSDQITANEWYIANAGLVICAYFFNPFFKGLNLLSDGKFINESSQVKAIHLTQYLVTESQEVPEFLLPLNKVLCGLPVSESIERQIKLLPEELTEADNLLQAIIKHWTILGNTSLTSLRNTFLMRKGKLSFENGKGCWLLQVEKKGYDICLGQLPWTISVIKLPWMPEKLFVEWV